MIDPEEPQPKEPATRLLKSGELQVINIGLSRFADTFARQGLKFVHLDWRPPAEDPDDLAAMLDALNH